MSEYDQEGWPSIAEIMASAKHAYHERLYCDMVALLERGIQRKAGEMARPYTTAINHEQELSTEISQLTYEIARLKTQLASPPAPWKTFGQIPVHQDVEYWGEDGTGLPIWERVREEKK
jgi:hypothetical protein